MKKIIYLFLVLAFVSCQSGNKKTNVEAAPESVEVVEATVNIRGMHCDMCVASIEKGINGLEGITSVAVSLNDSNAVVKFNPSKTDLKEIEGAIVKRGYTIRE